jgi:hypothetical protein
MNLLFVKSSIMINTEMYIFKAWSIELWIFRLKAVINKSEVMLFMKGDRDTPRCGFSKQMISILADTG